MLDYDLLHSHRKFLLFLVIHLGLVTEEMHRYCCFFKLLYALLSGAEL